MVMYICWMHMERAAHNCGTRMFTKGRSCTNFCLILF
jgi:hypothetical protein